MKQAPASTLSGHLLREAQKFQFYPERVHRSRSTLGAQELVDKGLRHLADWRKTFAPLPEDPVSKVLLNPVFLDELYCRDLLTGIPAMAERTLKLRHLTFAGIFWI